MSDLFVHITPDWLTEVLRSHGHLPHGHVTRIERSHAGELLYSSHIQCVAAYSPDAPATAPTHVFLKIARPQAQSIAQREIRFYALIAPHVPAMPIVPYYGSGTLADDSPFILLGDLSPSHYAWNDALPPRSHIDAIIGVLAQIHSDWWESSALSELLPEPPDAVIADLFSSSSSRYAELSELLGDQLSADDRQIFERYLAYAPALFQRRLETGKALTLCHPDNHHANFLFPRSSTGPIYVIDWHVYRRWWGLIDMVALITRAVAPEHHDQADDLLRAYYRQLLERGVTGYSWEACWYDYRLSVIDTLRVILSFTSRPERALQNLGPIMQEFRRCRCSELLG